MSSVDVNPKLSYKHPRQTDELATVPVAAEDTVRIPVERVAMLKGVVNEVLGEYADTAAKVTTAKSNTETNTYQHRQTQTTTAASIII